MPNPPTDGSNQSLSSPSDAEEARRYAEAVVNTVQQPLLVLNGELRVEIANPAFYRTFQVEPSDTEERPVYQLGNGQWDIPDLRRLLEEVLPTCNGVDDYRVVHEFEQIGRRVMLLNANRMERVGRPDRILLAINDVTDAERSRWELEAQKEYSEKIVDAARDALLILGWDLRVRSANETFYNTFRVDRADTEGRMVYELGNGQWDIPRLRELLENVLPDNDAFDHYEVRHEFEDIGPRIMLLNARRVDHTQLILLAIEDVTERRSAERALRESEERFRVLVEAAAQAVWEADAEGAVVQDSPSWRAYSGQRVEDWLTYGWLDAVHSDDRAHAERQWREAVEAGRSVDAELRLKNASGGWRWTNVRMAPLRDASGRISKWVGMNIDITPRKEAEAERELLLGELNHRVKNLFAIIQALAAHSNGERSAADFQSVFLGRLDALIRAHNLALEGEWRDIDLGRLAATTLAPYMDGHRLGSVEVQGFPVELDARRVLSLSLVLHELATNAVKYGALSVPEGRVGLTWEQIETDGGRQVRLTWDESGGPPVETERKTGFGTRLVQRVFEYELGGEAELDLRPEGLRLVASFPLV